MTNYPITKMTRVVKEKASKMKMRVKPVRIKKRLTHVQPPGPIKRPNGRFRSYVEGTQRRIDSSLGGFWGWLQHFLVVLLV